MPSSETLPIEALPGWARLNGLEFPNCKLDQTEDKGIGLVATSELSLAAGDAGLDDDKPLLKVPRDVVLGADTIEDFAKVDQNFRQLLDVAGKQTPRGDILVYMLAHLVSTRRGLSGGKGVTSTAWTEYLKFLPREVLVPTLWSSAERVLLEGTSLEQAVYAKQNALDHEFDQLREKSSGLPFWDSLFWDRDACVEFSKVLKDIEGSLLEDTLSSLEKEQAALLADDGVKAILGAMEASQNDEQLPTSAPNEGPGDDFS